VQCQSIVDGIPSFVDLLRSNKLETVEQAIWIIGKLLNDSVLNRDKIIKVDGLINLIQVVERITN
jgi:hypothetical protein